MIHGFPPPGEEMVLLAEAKPTSGTEVIFAGISQNYDDLFIVYRELTSAAAGTVEIEFNGDSTATNYAREFWRYIEAVNPAQGGSDQDGDVSRSYTLDGQRPTGMMWIPEYTNTNRVKQVQTYGMWNAILLGFYRNPLWNSTAAINQVRIWGDQAFTTPTHILLYGVRRRRIL